LGRAWGEEFPDAEEEASPWRRWKLSGGGPITVTGDPDWGKAIVDSGVIYGDVLQLDSGAAVPRTFTIEVDKYGLGEGAVDAYIRGHVDTIFGQLDGTPSWNLYVGPTAQTWKYVQIRLDEA
jgi:hypothetical protein